MTAADTILRALGERRAQLEREINTNIDGLSHEETVARVDALTDKQTALDDEIAAQPATTIEGLLIKLRILIHLEYPSEQYSSGRMMLAVLADAERIAGGLPGTLSAGEEERQP